jgi:hypothetical protein
VACRFWDLAVIYRPGCLSSCSWMHLKNGVGWYVKVQLHVLMGQRHFAGSVLVQTLLGFRSCMASRIPKRLFGWNQLCSLIKDSMFWETSSVV